MLKMNLSILSLMPASYVGSGQEVTSGRNDLALREALSPGPLPQSTACEVAKFTAKLGLLG